MKNNRLTLQKDFTYRKGVADAILKIVSIYSSLGVKQTLTKRESEFYVCLVIITLLGYHIYSEESDDIFNSIYGKHRRYERKDMLKKVIKREWAKEVGADIELPPFLRDLDLEEGEFVFNVKITWNEEQLETL